MSGVLWWGKKLEVDWASRRHNWCFLSYILCWDDTTTSMWTTSNGCHSTIFLVSIWIVEACYLCEWLSPSKECNASIGSRLVQWNKFLCHMWGTYGWHMLVSHYDIPLDDHVEWELHPQHSLRHRSQYWRVVADRVRRVLEMRTSGVSNHWMIVFVTSPHTNISLPKPLVTWTRAHAIWENSNMNLW